jgi:hypothetical protein
MAFVLDEALHARSIPTARYVDHMKILLTPDSPPALADPDDFQAFSVEAAPGADLSTLGRADGETHVFIAPAALRGLPGARPDDAAWAASLDAMLAYAQSKGWTDEAGHVRAHVEWAR